MAVETLQCPKCGAPLRIEPDREHTYCSYCGAALKLTQGVSGHQMAVLDDNKTDTSILAKEVALRRLTDKVTEKQMEQQDIAATRETERKALPHDPVGKKVICAFVGVYLIALGIAACFAEGGFAKSGVLFIAIGVFFLFLASRQTEVRKRREGLTRIAELDAQIDALSQEIEDIHETIRAHKTDMDHLTDQI